MLSLCRQMRDLKAPPAPQVILHVIQIAVVRHELWQEYRILEHVLWDDTDLV